METSIRCRFLSLFFLLGLIFACAQEAENPIIWADVPDVSVMRVNNTYYMSSTTMHMSPGLPIMKSKDLVNWEIAGKGLGPVAFAITMAYFMRQLFPPLLEKHMFTKPKTQKPDHGNPIRLNPFCTTIHYSLMMTDVFT